MRIAVFDLGYVGIVSAACFARDGHQVIGVDPQREKVSRVNADRTLIVDQYVGELVGEGVAASRFPLPPAPPRRSRSPRFHGVSR
jgi:GDP-mannose 6-dehydrogenase